MSTSYYDPSFDPVIPSEPDTPVTAEAKLQEFQNALEAAERDLKEARDKEVDAKSDFDEARRRAYFDPDCPKVGVFDGVRVTVAYQKAWIEEQSAEKKRAYELAKATRQAAYERLRTLGKNGGFQQSITSSVREAYRGTGSRPSGRWVP